MGGIIFIIAFVCASLIWGFYYRELFVVIGAVLAFGFIGFLDDFFKIALKRSLGLRAREKLLGQFLCAFVLMYMVCRVFGRGTEIILPGLDLRVDLGWGYYVFMSIYTVFLVNAVNLTDGLDGLCAGISFLVFFGLYDHCFAGHRQCAGFWYALYRLGGCFRRFSRCLSIFFSGQPLSGQSFYGRCGLPGPGGVGVVALMMMTKTEIISLLICLMFIVEAVSVTLQVISFHLFGKRIFLMSPLHHHFEMKGWGEVKIVYTFCAVAGLGILLGLWLTVF